MIEDPVQVLAESLAAGGISHAFGITGSGASLRLIADLQDQGVEYYSVGHEAAAAIMAGACGRDGHGRGVAISIRGPGFINLAPGILANRYEARPSVTVSESLGTQPPAARQHKRLDQSLISSVIAKAHTVYSGDGEQVSCLLGLANAERPGPVHIDLGPAPEAVSGLRPSPASEEIDAAGFEALIETIRSSKRPALIIGSSVHRAASALDWNALQIPMTTTAAAKGVVDETGDYAAGVVTGEVSSLSPESGILRHADLLLGIGLRNEEMVKAAAYGSPLVLIDAAAGGGAGFDAKIELPGVDYDRVLPHIFEALTDHHWGPALIVEHRAKVHAAVVTGEWLPGEVFALLDRRYRRGDTVVLDTGFFCTVGETIWRARTTDDFCGSSVGRFMGIGIPTAIGAALADRERRYFCCFGDGGVAPYFSEIALAVEYNLPIVFMFFSDGGFGSVAAFTVDTPAIRRAVTAAGGRWRGAVQALGCDARAVAGTEALHHALDDWDASGPLFIEMRFDAERYAQTAIQLR